ncbi:MAG: hypothetical protein ACOH5I_10945 [Oligoflexus sp.]
MPISYLKFRLILISWVSIFVAVASVPRCNAISDLIELFRTHHVEELVCHSPDGKPNSIPVAAHYSLPEPCPCITLDFADFFQSPHLEPKFTVLTVFNELDVSIFVNRFWQFHRPYVDVPPPRLA